MKKIIFILTLLFSTNLISQSTQWLPMVINEGKDAEYLELEKNWMQINQALIDDGYINNWSVWKRTPKEGDDGWAQYFVIIGNNDEMSFDSNEFNSYLRQVFKGKSQRAIQKMISTDVIFSERRNLLLNWVGATIYSGSALVPGDKMYFHYMTQKNDNFEDLEMNVWKPIADGQILDGIRKFWGLAKIDQKSENFTGIYTHLAINIMNGDTFSQTQDSYTNWDFETTQLMSLVQDSRDMLDAEELTLIYIAN